MSKETAIDLSLVDTDVLVQELCRRHENIIIIREDRKDIAQFYVSAKTPFGEHTNKNAGFDLICAMDLLTNATAELVIQHFELKLVTDEPQDADSGPTDSP